MLTKVSQFTNTMRGREAVTKNVCHVKELLYA
jgi:hypothetical protein